MTGMLTSRSASPGSLREVYKPIPKEILICITILLLLFVALYLPIFSDMYHLWIGDSNNSHGLLVPFISFFLIWRKREKINWENAKSSNIGLVILVISLVFYVVGYLGGLEVVPRLTIVSTLIGLIIFNLGLEIFLVLVFPLLFLLFMVPIPVSIIGLVSFPLQLVATKISVAVIDSLSIPVLREGNLLHLATSSLEVAEACSGIRSVMAFLMIGLLFAYFMNSSNIRRAIMILSALPLSFFTNILRVTSTGILANFFGARVARGFLHGLSGMAVFCLGMILFFILYRPLNKNRGAYQE